MPRQTLLTWDEVHAAVAAGRARWAHLAVDDPSAVPIERLREIHAEIAAEAVRISGTTRDALLRAVLYTALYEDSQRNFMFPLVAAHGSLWGVTHTETIDGALGPLRRVSRHGRVQRWLEALDDVRDVNRRVFREIYTTWHFTRYYGQHPSAAELVHPEVLAVYNRVHTAIRLQRPLTLDERRDAYFSVFVHEQEDIVDPGLHAAAAAAGKLMLEAFKRVSPRFAYFPKGERLWFTDFTEVEQRNREGLRALAFAEQMGPDHVFAAMSDYAPWVRGRAPAA
jgi:hypothetical protein